MPKKLLMKRTPLSVAPTSSRFRSSLWLPGPAPKPQLPHWGTMARIPSGQWIPWLSNPSNRGKNRGTSAWPVIWHPMVDPPTFYSGAHKARTKMIVAWALSLRSVCNSICPKCFWRSCFFSENLWSVHASLVPQMCKTTESSHVHTQTAVGDKMLVGLPMPWAARKFLSCRQC